MNKQKNAKDAKNSKSVLADREKFDN